MNLSKPPGLGLGNFVWDLSKCFKNLIHSHFQKPKGECIFMYMFIACFPEIWKQQTPVKNFQWNIFVTSNLRIAALTPSNPLGPQRVTCPGFTEQLSGKIRMRASSCISQASYSASFWMLIQMSSLKSKHFNWIYYKSSICSWIFVSLKILTHVMIYSRTQDNCKAEEKGICLKSLGGGGICWISFVLKYEWNANTSQQLRSQHY